MGQQVTSLTAEKSLELANENIIGAVISGGHLILRRRNWDPAHPTDPATTINVGSVIGPTGPAGGAKIVAFDTSSSTDDPLGPYNDTWYTLAGVTATTPALVNGHKYAVDYYTPLQTNTDLTNWDVDLLRDGTAVHRANAFAPDNGRTVVASGRYYFTASGTASLTFTMRARMTTDTLPYSIADNSFAPSSIAVIHFEP